MKFFKNWFRTRKFWKRFALTVLITPILLLAVVITIVYVKQDEIVQELIQDMNTDFKGAAEIDESHISLFENFPYISVDLQGFKVYETKQKSKKPIAHVDHAYIGFDIWTILTGNMKVKKIKLSGGHMDVVQHLDGSFNIVNALSPEKEIESAEEEFNLDLKSIELENMQFTKFNEENGLLVEAKVSKAESEFSTSAKNVNAKLDAQFIVNIIHKEDTTFFANKHLDLSTNIDFDKNHEVMRIHPTTAKLEGADFTLSGSVDFLKDVLLDLNFEVNKDNFDFFIAMAPEYTMKWLQTYENKGNIYFKTSVKGRSINGHTPHVKASFGCKNGYFKNKRNGKTLKGIAFDGYFTNGENRETESMLLKMSNIKARPGLGTFKGDVKVFNFRAPDVLLNTNVNLDLDFISKFLSMDDFKNLAGKAKLTLDYHDVIDLKNPEKTLSELNQKYKLQVDLDKVRFQHKDLPVPVKELNLIANLQGHEAAILQFDLFAGKSDIHMKGVIEDIPAIIHHTDKPVLTELSIKSKFIDLFELTGSGESAMDEQITDLDMDFHFKASARSFTESKYLPEGEFFIDNVYAKLKYYPHTFHDFHADIFVEEKDLKVVDFSGMIDKSDFHFSGLLEDYSNWFEGDTQGDTRVEYKFDSKRLLLESLFTYQGENYVPEEYRHEEFDDIKLSGFVLLHYKNGEFLSTDVNIDNLTAKMKVHPLRLRDFQGRVHYEKDHLVVEEFQGKMGHSDFKTTLHYYLGDDENQRKRENHFSITATRLDIDELIKYNPTPVRSGGSRVSVDHNSGFNVYELPFTDMTYDLDIGLLNYHMYRITQLRGKLRTTPNHYIYVDDFNMNLASGNFKIDGYFNGSNPDLIYFHPTIKVKNVDLDQLLLRFENFGQDYIVSENLHGKFSGVITGKIHVYPDLVPKIDDSDIHMELDVVKGRLENYALLQYMSDYFKDKNLNSVLFDTLNNELDIENGIVTIPEMTVNSSLGHMKISGTQSLDGTMEYQLQIPWKMVAKTARSRLFGRKKDEEVEQELDEIQYGNEKTRYVNLRIVGDADGYKFSIGKKKKGK
ncbi:MAG: AsmA-like C-terminal region-containing protein [Fluviicola sp.]